MYPVLWVKADKGNMYIDGLYTATLMQTGRVMCYREGYWVCFICCCETTCVGVPISGDSRDIQDASDGMVSGVCDFTSFMRTHAFILRQTECRRPGDQSRLSHRCKVPLDKGACGPRGRAQAARLIQ